jgi:choline dehydrogenase-like flavoprotein
MSERHDVIIIGSGAGGGTLAHRLAPSGKKILILERGDWLPREALNWNVDAVFADNRYVSPDTWMLPDGKTFQPQVHYFVGGATKVFGAALYRLRKEDFGELQHHDGVSPAWPLGYDELEPYYTEAEHLYQVHGEHGSDPTEPPASKQYPAPPVSSEPRIQKLFDDMTAAGYHPFPAPAAVLMNERDMAYSRCIRCRTCDGFPCLVHAKSDAEVISVRPALERPNVTLLRHARALKLETNAAGTSVVGVLAEVNGAPERFVADIVVVSCGAANSAALLLRSADDKHPAGLANRSGQVGRNYMFHNSQAVLALSLTPNDTMFQKTLALNDFYFGTEGFPYPMGNIQ